jgi:RNA recognition motif-containing protein
MNIYVGNLSFEESESSLEAAFAVHGAVTAARIITDRETGRSRGFGFVEMSDATQAQAAIAALSGTTVNGRELTVNEAKPREERAPRSGGGGGYGGGSRW